MLEFKFPEARPVVFTTRMLPGQEGLNVRIGARSWELVSPEVGLIEVSFPLGDAEQGLDTW